MMSMIRRLVLAALCCLAPIVAHADTTGQCVASVVGSGSGDKVSIPSLGCHPLNMLSVIMPAANATTTPTLQENTQAVQTIVHADGTALNIGDIAGAGFVALFTQSGSKWILLNPALSASAGTVPSGSGFSIGTNLFVANPLTPNPDNTPTSNTALGVGAEGNIAPIHSTQYDTALGYQALGSLTTGDHITAVGAWALTSITDTTGNHNTGIGVDALRFLTAGVDNVAVGESSCTISTGNNNSTCIGFQAAEFGAAGEAYETAVGSAAMLGTVGTPLTGVQNTAVGGRAMVAIAGVAHDNTVVGYQAGLGITTGNTNTFIGSRVGQTNPTTGQANILMGWDSTTNTATAASTNTVGIGGGTVVGSSDVCIGTASCASTNADNNNNAVVGTSAGNALTSGANNAIFGGNAGKHITTGLKNTILGNAVAPTTLTTGARNIALGTASSCDFAASNTSDTLIVCESTGANYLLKGNLTAAAPQLAIGGPVLPGGPYSAAGTAIPACSATYTNYIAIVTDANTPTYGGTYASGGAVSKVVLCNGTNWLT